MVADIRSVPFSARFSEYHQDALRDTLAAHEIRYVYLGEELGPRSREPAHYDSSGQVQFARLQESELFQSGVSRLSSGLDNDFSIALLCAEKDPAICHRSLLVGHYLVRHLNIEVQHIGHEGTLESQQELEQRLIQLHGMQADMLTDDDELLALAYQQQLKNCAYRRS